MIFDEPLDQEICGIGSEFLCPLCRSALLVARHCKKLCEACGYVESCEDNFLPIEANPAVSTDLKSQI